MFFCRQEEKRVNKVLKKEFTWTNCFRCTTIIQVTSVQKETKNKDHRAALERAFNIQQSQQPIPGSAHLMKGLHNAYHIIEDDDGLPLAQPLLLDDVMLEVDQIRRLVAEVVGTQAVEHQADPFLHLSHFVSLQVLHYFVGSILRKTVGAGEGVFL